MPRVLVRMERATDDVPPPVVPGVTVRRWDRTTDHDRVPRVYAAAFEEQPWPDDWDRFDEFDPGGVFVAEDRGSLVGFTICFPRDPGGYVSVVAVIRSHRRRGIASALVEAAITHLGSRGARVIRIDAWGDSPAAVGTYLALGFTPYEVKLDDDP